MSKLKKPQQRWVCQACGAVSTGWFGKCPTCDAWNSIEEETPAPAPGERPSGRASVVASTEAQTIVDQQPRRPPARRPANRTPGVSRQPLRRRIDLRHQAEQGEERP